MLIYGKKINKRHEIVEMEENMLTWKTSKIFGAMRLHDIYLV